MSKVTRGFLMFTSSSFITFLVKFLQFPLYLSLRFIFEFEIYNWV
ncbi:unnamed protein product [Brassica rapa subsp. narinosa]